MSLTHKQARQILLVLPSFAALIASAGLFGKLYQVNAQESETKLAAQQLEELAIEQHYGKCLVPTNPKGSASLRKGQVIINWHSAEITTPCVTHKGFFGYLDTTKPKPRISEVFSGAQLEEKYKQLFPKDGNDNGSQQN